MTTKTKIILLAHDNLQAQLNNFIEQNDAVLKRFHLIASNINRKNFTITENLPFSSLQGEELALDTDLETHLETQILSQNIAGVIFLIDSANFQEQEVKIDVFLRICSLSNIPLATNLATAE